MAAELQVVIRRGSFGLNCTQILSIDRAFRVTVLM